MDVCFILSVRNFVVFVIGFEVDAEVGLVVVRGSCTYIHCIILLDQNSAIENAKLSYFGDSKFSNPQSSILNPQSSILNPQFQNRLH